MHHSIAYGGWTLLWLTRHNTKKLNITMKLKLEKVRKVQKRDTGCCPCWANSTCWTEDQQVGEGARNPLKLCQFASFAGSRTIFVVQKRKQTVTWSNWHFLGEGDSVALDHWIIVWKQNVSLTLHELKSIKSKLPQRDFFTLQKKLRKEKRQLRPPNPHGEHTLGVCGKDSTFTATTVFF